MNYKFTNLVFEGGGVKGIAYVGALSELRKLGILENIKRVGGTSAGAINALLVGLNYTEDEVKDILWNLDFKKFMDDSWFIGSDIGRLINDYGWHKGDFFRKWIGQIIQSKTGNSESTFADLIKLGFKDLYFIGTNLSTHCSEIYSFEHTPRTCVADAIRISMSIPLFFKVIKSIRGDILVDGGVLLNYPIKIFDRKKYLEIGQQGIDKDYYTKENEKIVSSERTISQYVFNDYTLGFRLDTKEEISVFRDHAEPVHNKIENLFEFASNLIETLMDFQQSTHLHSDDWMRTIYIDSLGIGTTDFTINDDKKKSLIESGRIGVKKFFEWFNNKDKIEV